jgi:GNAT superfamily N-acetyltransferase
MTGVVDGEVLAVGGIAYLPDGTHGAFLLADERARKYPVALHKAGLHVLQQARKFGIAKVVAMADPHIKPAKRWLKRLGFEPVTVDQQEVWLWHSSSR